MIINCKDIEKSFGANQVLKKAALMLGQGEKMALVGVNGAGKTTLFKIITQELAPDSGEVVLKKGASIAYLSQHMELNPDNTIYNELTMVFSKLIDMEAAIKVMQEQMASLKGDALDSLMEKYAKATKEFEDNNGYEYKSRVRGVLAGLGFDETELLLNIAKLSGGQKTRVALGKLLLMQPDLLLLDEPTNHLDIKAITWLEDYFLREYKNAVIIISHDRYFLDKVAKKVVEVEHGKTKSYNGNYSYFVEKKAKDYEIEMHHYTSQQKEIAKQMESIRLLRSFNREKSVKRARSKEKQLAKVDKLDKPMSAPDKMRLALTPSIQSGNDVLTIKAAQKSFGARLLFDNVNMEIKRGENVALIGENGVGKTTLFNMIRNNDNSIILGTNVKIGYYDQELKFDNADKSIFQEISDTYPRMKNLEIRNALASFLFVADDVDKKLGMLSGGEKGRVALCKLMLSDANFLMLDEPTNHLDLFSKEILESALLSYQGTVLYISHDRYFINNTAEKIYEMHNTGSILYLGNYDYYIEKKAQAPIIDNNKANTQDQSQKEQWLKNKEELSNQRKQKALIAKLEAEIEKIEKNISEVQDLLQKEEISTNATKAHEIYLQKVAMEEELSNLLLKWEEASNNEIY